MKPEWWPTDIPWQNVRSDMRSAEKKKEVPWTEGLRRIVISCYLHHGRLDLLPEFSIEHLPQISAETAQQIQLQLERLQQQHGGGGGGGGGGSGVTGRSVGGGGEAGGGGGGEGGMMDHSAASGTQLVEAGGGEVFTVDTGIGNCDNSGMPTLADATLAEAAAKLQQVLWIVFMHGPTGSCLSFVCTLYPYSECLFCLTVCTVASCSKVCSFELWLSYSN